MKKYNVLITRDYTHIAHIVVEAENEEEAEETALAQISNEELTLDGIVPDSDCAEVQGENHNKMSKSERMSKLQKLYHKDQKAVEMARRKVAFHLNEEWDAINLWGLFDYNKKLQAYLDDGRLLNKQGYVPENRTYWVTPSQEYWENDIKPIVEFFTVEDLQETFNW